MEEWTQYKLGDIANPIKDRIDTSVLDKDSYISTENMLSNKSGVTKSSGVPSGSAVRFQEGDILISNIRPYFKKIWRADFVGGCSADVICLRATNKVEPLFLFYMLSQDVFFDYVMQGAKGTKMPRGDKKQIMQWPVLLPPLNEQKQIAALFKSFDDKIEVNRRINDNLEQQAQALFKSWLSQCKDEVTIGDLSLNITDYTKCKRDKVVLINSSDVSEGYFEHHILSENKDLKGHFKKRFQKGDILYSQVRPRNRHWGYCTFDADNYLASTQLMVIRNRPELISSILLYQYIIDEKVWLNFTLKTETRSGTFPQGNYEDLSSIKVPFGAEVNQISSVLESLYSRIFDNEKESNLLANLRDTLLPKLMSGELIINETI